MISGNIVVTALVTIMLILFLSSLRYGLITLLPNLIPALVTFGCWGLLVGEINMAVAVVFCITLGIVVDDTVHFTAKFLHARRTLDLDPEASLQHAYRKVGDAMWITTLTLILGFLVLTLSALKVNSAMGALVALTIAVAFIFDLMLFPRLLLWLEQRQHALTQPSTTTLAGLDGLDGNQQP
jgi:predicted RND superfamily exporter protein